MIKEVNFRNFMGFESFHCTEFAPVNVIIGKNDTGKTGLLKMLYAACKVIDTYSMRSSQEDVSLKKLLAEKLLDTFQPGKKGLGELVNKQNKEKMEIDIEFYHHRLKCKSFGQLYNDRLHFSFGDSTTNTINDCQDKVKMIDDGFRCLFVPAKEVLTPLKAIRATRDNLHIHGFDDTYLDLIKSLVLPAIKGRVNGELNDVNVKLEELFNGRIEQQGSDDDFVFKRGKSEYMMSLTSEGVKKIGILTTLIRNRQLNSTSILFMDEPETTLHPGATRKLVEMIMLMAKAGVQIFIATHNYFVLKQMHLIARQDKMKANCYSLLRNREGFMEMQMYDLQNDYPENEISDEAIKMSDEEIMLDLGLNGKG